MFAADLISGVPSFLIGPLALLYDGSDDIEDADCLLKANLVSGVPSFFSGPSQEDDVTAERLVCAGDAGFLSSLSQEHAGTSEKGARVRSLSL